MTNKNYLDLREGETLIVDGNQESLEIKVTSVTSRSIRLTTPGGFVIIRRGQFANVGVNIGVFNYGSRGRGKRAHVRLQTPSYYSFELRGVQGAIIR